MKNDVKKEDKKIEKRLCAQEVYFWLLHFRNSLLISIVFILVLACLGEPIISFPIAIFVIVFFIMYLRRVIHMIKSLEHKYGLKGRMKA